MSIPRILVIVDFQNDFVSGSLAVPDADKAILPTIDYGNAVLDAGGEVVLTRDWHPANHSSFVGQGGPWPSHCVQGTPGAEFRSEIRNAFPYARVFSKGQDPEREEYSGFMGVDYEGRDLGGYILTEHGPTPEVDVAGLALEYCVKNTAYDMWTAGFFTQVILDATRPVDYITGAQTLLELGHYDQGELHVITSDEANQYLT